MRNFIALVAVAGLAVVGLAATGNLSLGNAAADSGGVTVTTTQEGADGLTPQPAPEGKSIGLCIDPTASTDKAFAKATLASAINAVKNYLPVKPATKEGVTAVPGLDLTVRLVSTRPLAYGQPYLNIQVPAVVGLPPRPDMTAPGALDPGGPYLAWKQSETQWTSDFQAAQDAIESAIKRLGEIDLANPGRSGVRECAAALVSVAPTYANATLIVASDLGDNSFTGAKPNFDGKPLILIQPCADGNAKHCSALQNDFIAWTSNHGAGQTSITRPEDTANTFAQLITSDIN